MSDFFYFKNWKTLDFNLKKKLNRLLSHNKISNAWNKQGVLKSWISSSWIVYAYIYIYSFMSKLIDVTDRYCQKTFIVINL